MTNKNRRPEQKPNSMYGMADRMFGDLGQKFAGIARLNSQIQDVRAITSSFLEGKEVKLLAPAVNTRAVVINAPSLKEGRIEPGAISAKRIAHHAYVFPFGNLNEERGGAHLEVQVIETDSEALERILERISMFEEWRKDISRSRSAQMAFEIIGQVDAISTGFERIIDTRLHLTVATTRVIDKLLKRRVPDKTEFVVEFSEDNRPLSRLESTREVVITLDRTVGEGINRVARLRSKPGEMETSLKWGSIKPNFSALRDFDAMTLGIQERIEEALCSHRSRP